jgi:hypothetical protein
MWQEYLVAAGSMSPRIPLEPTLKQLIDEAVNQGCMCISKRNTRILHRTEDECIRVILPNIQDDEQLSEPLHRHYARVLKLDGYEDDPPADWEPTEDEQT